MTLEEIGKELSLAPCPSVPSWAFGTVQRRSITFATGFCDPLTRVVWVQSHGMSGDIRIHPRRPALPSGSKLSGLSLEDLTLLASVEGGVAATSWADGVMSWNDWIGFQVYDKYPEPGLMQRIGDCMIEFAPSGIYVEDWRFQPSNPGVLAGLRLVSETGHGGETVTRRGGLVIAGDHAICSLARLQELPEGTRAQNYVRESSTPAAALEHVFQCSVSYASRSNGVFRIAVSTDPRCEGTTAGFTDDFAMAPQANHVVQKISGDPAVASRLWKIDSLECGVAFPMETEVAADRLAWLEAESDSLVDPVRISLRSSP